MLRVNFEIGGKPLVNVLCLGSHCDDIEIGCGGTILRLMGVVNNLNIHWIVFSSDEQRELEAYDSANEFLTGAKGKSIVIKRFRNGFFPFDGAEIKEYFERLKTEFIPDLIFTHYRNDLHQDHRLISDLTWHTYRNHSILEYEIPKYDGDLGSPNFFVQLNETICQKKIKNILTYYKSQTGKEWFTKDTFLSILRIRGIESNAPSKYAEGFYCRKLIF